MERLCRRCRCAPTVRRRSRGEAVREFANVWVSQIGRDSHLTPHLLHLVLVVSLPHSAPLLPPPHHDACACTSAEDFIELVAFLHVSAPLRLEIEHFDGDFAARRMKDSAINGRESALTQQRQQRVRRRVMFGRDRTRGWRRRRRG